MGFLKILSDSIKLVLKNGKSIASITTLSLLLSSFLLLLFSYCYKVTRAAMKDSGAAISHLLLIIFLALSLTFLFAYVVIIHASGLATVLASAASYTGTRLSSQDLFSMVKTKWGSPFTRKRRGSRNLMHLLWMIQVMVAVPVAMFNPNTVTITIASVVGVSFFIFAAGAAAVVTVVVEDGCNEVVEKAERLVEGRRVDGLMVNLLFNVVVVMISFCFWLIVGDKGRLNLMVYGLFFVNCISMSNILWNLVYAAYYFQCVEYHGQTIHHLFGNFHYTTLPNPNDDIP